MSTTYVFLSYSRANNSFAQRLVADLQRNGITVWVDQSGLTPGTPDWETALRDAISKAHAVILLASEEARKSPYVKDELRLAHDFYHLPVYPLWVAGTQWINSIPLGWGGTQYIDARGDEAQYQAALDQLIDALHGANPVPSLSPTSTHLAAALFSPGKSNLFRTFTLIGMALLILGSVVFIHPWIIKRGGGSATATTSVSAQLTATAAATAYANGIGASGMMFGFDAQHTHFNPYEKVLSPINVSGLVKDWQVVVGNKEKIYSSPAVAGGVVFVGSADGHLYAFVASTGNFLWAASTGGYINSSPAVAKGLVYIGSADHKLYAFNAKGYAQSLSGCGISACPPIWSASTGGSIFSSPVVANGVIYVGSEDHKLYAFNAATGKVLWMASTGDVIHSSPAVDNNVVYVGSEDRKLYAFNAKGCQHPQCSPLWTASTGDAIDSSPTVANRVVYVGSADGKLYAFNA